LVVTQTELSRPFLVITRLTKRSTCGVCLVEGAMRVNSVSLMPGMASTSRIKVLQKTMLPAPMMAILVVMGSSH
jgi:hypothetical protein